MLISGPMFDAVDAGGSGGLGDSGSSGQQAPSPIAVTKDSLLQFEGSKEPIKYSDWQAKYVDKAEYTKATQQAATREKQWQDYVANLQKQAEAKAAQAQGQATAQPNTWEQEMADLSSKTYVDGRTVASLVQRLVKDGIGGLGGAIQQRDQVIKLLYNQLQSVQQGVGSLRQASSTAERSALFHSAKTSANLPDDDVIQEFLEDIYLSHEGNDLNQEFPGMVSKRWTALVNAVRTWDKKQADAARTARFNIPGRGGAATPGGQVKKGFQTPEDIAKDWFPIISRSGTDT